MPEENGNGDNGDEIAEEIADDIAEEIVEEIVEELAEETAGDVDVEIDVIEAPEIPEPVEIASVDVGDLHISGPANMVQDITETYLKKHLDHNPHGEIHTPDIAADFQPESGGMVEDIGQAVTPDIVEEQIAEGIQGETVDSPPEPTDWLYRRIGGR